jgi:O-methyltransferase
MGYKRLVSLPRSTDDRYLELLRRTLTRADERYEPLTPTKARYRWLYKPLRRVLTRRGLELARRVDPDARAVGLAWPDHAAAAESMIGLKRMENIQDLVSAALRDDVPGDLVEAGVWRGGAAIFMRAILETYADADRLVWVADSFEGVPPPDVRRWPQDAGDDHHTHPILAVSQDEVRANFERYGMLDERVRFLPGLFADTLPSAPIDRIAVLRLDGDMYGSTMETLEPLYPKVSTSGFVIVDDYGLGPCRQAVEDYRATHGITDEIHHVDWTGVWWQKSERSAL